ncbi:hypothetical protein M1N59_00935 [Dehalococcoidales bacterium]|nr:hypothetical protein [Dehalococcoidales bacterium]
MIEVEELCRAHRELEVLLDCPKRFRLRAYPKELEAEELAMKVRQDLGLGYRPIRDLYGILRRQGVIIIELEIPEDVFSGSSCWHEEEGPAIV